MMGATNERLWESLQLFKRLGVSAAIIAKIYTRNVFEKSKEEWMKVKDYRVEWVNYDCGTYIVQHRERIWEISP